MIQHVSVTADDPKKTATTIAALLGGTALPLGPTEGTWTAVARDPIGNMVEVMPRGTEFHRERDRVEMRPGVPARHSGFHVMFDSPLSEEEIMQVAEERDAVAFRSKHGPFELLEFWIDDCLLLEVLPPTLSRSYRKFLESAEERGRYLSRLGLAESESAEVSQAVQS